VGPMTILMKKAVSQHVKPLSSNVTIASALMQSSGVIELQNVEIIVMKRVVISHHAKDHILNAMLVVTA